MVRVLIIFVLITFNLSSFGETIHWNKGRGYEPFSFSTPDGILIDNQSDTLKYSFFRLPETTRDFSLMFRSKNLNSHPTKKYSYFNSSGKEFKIKNPHWGFFICCEQDTFAINVKNCEIFSDSESQYGSEISIYKISSGQKEVVKTREIDSYKGDNLWKINLNEAGLKINGGGKGLSLLKNLSWTGEVTGFGFYAGWGDKIMISDITARFEVPSKEGPKEFSISSLDEYFKESDDPMEGYWTIFDRELEESLIKLGGFYTLACVKEGEDYNLIYIDGASVNSTEWETGDVKAILAPSPFPDIYNVVWYDSMKLPMHHDIKAQTGEGETLLFQFPYQSSKLRLRKIDKK